MDLTRAKEIMKAKDKIEVLLDGEPVWIESVDAQHRSAEVYMENDSKVHKNVPVDHLQEK